MGRREKKRSCIVRNVGVNLEDVVAFHEATIAGGVRGVAFDGLDLGRNGSEIDAVKKDIVNSRRFVLCKLLLDRFCSLY